MAQVASGSADLTLVVDRIIDASRATVWRCWTDPALLKQWYCPKPWQVAEADLDLRPGGRFNVVMQGPEGESIDIKGIYLDIKPQRKLVFSDSHTEGFIPQPSSFMTGFVELSDTEDGKTRVVWGARHSTQEAVQQHLEMGFEKGWNAALDQLQDLARTQNPSSQTKPLMDFPAKVRTCLFLENEAEQAAEFYTSILPDSHIEAIHRIEPTGQPLVVEFTLAGAPYMTLNGNPAPTPNHLSSISILTKDQEETDKLWEVLLDGGEEGRCGWLRDRFGIHWQIVPKSLPTLLYSGKSDAASRVFEALMTMSKIEIAELEAAYHSVPQQGETR